MTVNKTMIFAGVCTLLQALGQLVFATFGLLQHFCVIDFLKELPLLIYIRILYFHKPSTCGTRITIGQAIDGVAAQAFVLLQDEPFTAFRTFIINSVSAGLAVFWIITSVVILMGGARNKKSKSVQWPWIVVTVSVCIVDIVAAVTYANDSFHTRTLSDIIEFIGGTVSGIGNAQLDTAWASWTMVILYSRFVGLFIINIFLVITMVVECNMKRDDTDDTVMQVEAPVPVPTVQRSNEVATETSDLDDVDLELANTPSVERIPRPGLSQSFRRMKSILFKRTPSPEQHIRSSIPDSLETNTGANRTGEQPRIPRAGLTNSFRRMKTLLFKKSPTHERSKFYTDSLEASPERSPQAQHVPNVPIDKSDQKRTVNFPQNLSLPQRLENMIAEQQRRLDRSVVDTTGRRSPPRASQSLPHLDSDNLTEGRRGTTAGLPGQMPWAYIPASAHRMRDQLPPDEDLPPVPLPDYSAIPSSRKASVHRAASSLSSLTQKKDYNSRRPPLTHSDVLY